MKDEDMSLLELYESYDLSEKQQRKWLVKISRYWLHDENDKKANKNVEKILKVVERYIKGQATEKKLKNANDLAYATLYPTYNSARHHSANYYLAALTAKNVSESKTKFEPRRALVGPLDASAAYKELLLEVINEMDEFEREIRRKM